MAGDADAMRNVRLLLEYDGTNFVGWQRQQEGRSIQGEIESVLAQILQERVNVIGAGRTDAGVHARGQVANFRTESSLSIGEIGGGLAGLLPDDIVPLECGEVPPEFHARYSAKERSYSYHILLKPSALLRNYSWHLKYGLDVSLMEKAAEVVVGKRNFESFCKTGSGPDNHECVVSQSQWSRSDPALLYEIRANRFVRGMVRALVGTMVDVGRGHLSLNDFAASFEKRDRKEAGMSAPARGLVLESVVY